MDLWRIELQDESLAKRLRTPVTKPIHFICSTSTSFLLRRGEESNPRLFKRLRFSRPAATHVANHSKEDDVGFEPTDPLEPLVFKTSAIDRSANHPFSYSIV